MNRLLIVFFFINILKSMEEVPLNKNYNKFQDEVKAFIVKKQNSFSGESALKNEKFTTLFEVIEQLIDVQNKLKEKSERRSLLDKKLDIAMLGSRSLASIEQALLGYDIVVFLFSIGIIIDLSLLLSFKFDFFKNSINCLGIERYQNPKNIICIAIINILFWKIIQYFRPIKNSCISKDLEKNLHLLETINQEIHVLDDILDTNNKVIENLNVLLGVEETILIIQLAQAFFRLGKDISFVDALKQTKIYQDAIKNNTQYQLYHLFNSFLLTKPDDEASKKTIQAVLGIKDLLSVYYEKNAIFPNVYPIYGKENINIVNAFSNDIIMHFGSSKEKKNKCMNYLFYGAAGTGKSQMARNIIQRLITFQAIEVIEVKNSEIKTPDDMTSLRMKIDTLLAQNKKIIIMIDELDGIIRDRTQNISILDEKIITAMAQLIDDYREKQVVLLATTNHKEKLDQVIRDDRVRSFYCMNPDFQERYDIAYALLKQDKEVIDKMLVNDYDDIGGKTVKIIDTLGLLKLKKEKLVKAYAAFVSLFTVNDSQATIVEKTNILVDNFKTRGVDGKDNIEEVLYHTFSKICENSLLEKTIDPKELLNLIQSIMSQCGGDFEKVSDVARYLSSLEDAKYKDTIKSKEGFHMTGKNYQFNISIPSIKRFCNDKTIHTKVGEWLKKDKNKK
jgi:hypothetical protein